MSDLLPVHLVANRVSFPLNEAVHSWLVPLLDSYYEADKGICEAINRQLSRGRELACAKGCSSCCKTHKDIPVYPVELVGMTWYVTEKVTGEKRSRLKEQLANHNNIDGCPFLLGGECSIHPVRPLACRHFNVFGKQCAEGEDAYHTRRQDVLTPIKKYKEKALLITIPFYGDYKKSEQKKLVETGAINKLARPLKDCHWESLPEKMTTFDDRQ